MEKNLPSPIGRSLAGIRTAFPVKRPAVACGPNLQPSATQTQELIVDLVIRLNR
jgi:hypothetical protein